MIRLTQDEERLLLHLWSSSVDVTRKLPLDVRQKIDGLQQAIELLTNLPVAIGWEENATTLLAYATRQGTSG
jgi:hypothetical protein